MTAEVRGGRRALVTGGTGMIGANLVRRLLDEGSEVSVLCRRGSDPVRLRGVAGPLRLHEADVRDAGAVAAVVRAVEPEVVLHLASTPFNPSTIPERAHLDVIVTGTLNLLEALAGQSGVRVVCAGSAAEYGAGSGLREDATLHPGTVLGAAKAAASLLARAYSRLHGLEVVVLRLFTPYGPWEAPSRLISDAILSALDGRDVRIGHGGQERDFVYIDDVVTAFTLAATRPLPAGSLFNICSGRGTPIREVVGRVLAQMGDPVRCLPGTLPTRPDEIWEMSGDNRAARDSLGWGPVTSLDEGLARTIAWVRENRGPLAALARGSA
ncbi:MAG: NAD-dependent epimerase/dehydratase family protein [Planctomycetes bacterium]|nr:NAD-dependent epimerase/dehydratase family protein [Planctomycetota bacterium]